MGVGGCEGGGDCILWKLHEWPSGKESATGDTWTESRLLMSHRTSDSTLVERLVD